MAFNITLLLCDDMLASSTTLAAEIFQMAKNMARARRLKNRNVVVRYLSSDGQPVTSHSGLQLMPTHSLNDFLERDFESQLIHIPALWRNPRHALKRHAEFIPWLIAQQQKNVPIAAVGTGVCFLAEAGLLNGKPVTTHWHYFEQFEKQYPGAQLKRQHFTTQAGNIYCAASINAMAEVMMGLVERHFGRVIAVQAQRNFFHEIRNLNQHWAQTDQTLAAHSDETVIQVQIWLQDNLQKSVSFADIAAQLGLSQRTLDRRFKAAIGQTPLQYLNELRMLFACDLLKNSNLSISEVGGLSGIDDSTWFSTRFKQWAGVTPKVYRNTVRAKLFKIE